MKKNTILLLVLLVLAGIYVGIKYLGKDKSRSYSKVLIDVDTSDVDRIDIYNPTLEERFSLVRSGTQWNVQNGEMIRQVPPQRMKDILPLMSSIQAKQLISKSQEKRMLYELNDEKAIEVEIATGNGSTEMKIGKFNYNQATQGVSTYFLKDNAIFEVEGFYSLMLGSGANSFRDNTITKSSKSEIIRLVYDVGGQKKELINRNGNWQDDMSLSIDSIQMDGFLTAFTTLKGKNYYDLEMTDDEPIARVSVESEKIDENYHIDCYMINNDNEEEYLVKSSLNPDNVFTIEQEDYDILFDPIDGFENDED